MSLENIALKNIDDYLRNLTRDVGADNVEFYKDYMLGASTDHSKVLNLYLDWEVSIKKSWNEFKITSCPTSEIIKEYDEKLKKCDGYLNLMKNIFAEDTANKLKVNSLLERKLKSGIESYILWEDIDKAFELVKKMPWSGFTQAALDDIFNLYVTENRMTCWEKAYEVVFYGEKQFWDAGTYAQPKLDQIIEKCLSLKILAAEEFLNKILQHYPKCGDIFPPKKPYVPYSLKQLEDQLIEKGDQNVINHRQVETLAQNKKFKEALNKVESITNLVNKRSALIIIFEQCRESGDEESVKITLDLAHHKDVADCKNHLLLNIIETCKKNGLEKMALEAADRIDLPKLKEKQLRKINEFFSRSK